MGLLKVVGQMNCPKRLWAGMARDACRFEQAAGLCAPGCEEGARARREAKSFADWYDRMMDFRRARGQTGPRPEPRRRAAFSTAAG